jgi:hypothetical protein
MPVDRVTGGQVVASEWGNQVSDAIAAIEARLAALEAVPLEFGVGTNPEAYPMGMEVDEPSTTDYVMAAIYGNDLAGAFMMPVIVPAPMTLSSYTIRHGVMTQGQRFQLQVCLFTDNGVGQVLTQVPGSFDYFDTIAPAGAANLNSNASVTGTMRLSLKPGVYLVAARNFRADGNFVVRYKMPTEFRARNSLRWSTVQGCPNLNVPTLDLAAYPPENRDVNFLGYIRLNGVSAGVPQRDEADNPNDPLLIV